MSSFRPTYQRISGPLTYWALLQSLRKRSWIEMMSEVSYTMEMGEHHLLGKPIYIANDPAVIRKIMVSDVQAFPKSTLLRQALLPLIGDSVLITNGETWQQQHDMVTPSLDQARLDMVFPTMREATDDMLARLAPLAQSGARVDFAEEMTRVTADIIFRTIFSQPLSEDDFHRIFVAFERYQSMAMGIYMPYLYSGRTWSTAARKRRLADAANVIRDALARLVRPRWQARQQGQTCAEPDILAALLDARNPTTGAPMDLKELVNQVATLFLAGHETSASALAWAFAMLARHPETQDKASQEVHAQLAERPIERADIKTLPYVRNVFRETLRLYPPLSLFVRQNTVDGCPLRDKKIPADALMIVSPWLVQRHRRRWSEPDRFRPERWSESGIHECMRQAYMPFGMGPRVCPGAGFALQEASLILASVLRRFQVQPAWRRTPYPLGRLTTRPKDGVLLELRPREPAAG